MKHKMTKDEKEKFVAHGGAWMYEFDLGDGVKTPLLAEELRSVHQTREQMIMPLLDDLFGGTLRSSVCLDVACNEGYFSHLLYQRGAQVKGIDIREINIHRARTVQEMLGLDVQRLSFERMDFFEIQDPPGRYDLVLFLGVLYHLEDPMKAVRLLYSLTKRVCVIETQLTRQQAAIVSGWGQAGVFLHLPASFAVHQETDSSGNRLASMNSLSFIPNAAAVKRMLFAAGFQQVIEVCAHPSLDPQYVQGDRGVFVAIKK